MISAYEYLKKNQCSVFSLPQFEELTFVRMATEGLGACFVHAVLTDLCGQEFIEKSRAEKQEIVKNFRSEVSDNLRFDFFMTQETKTIYVAESLRLNLPTLIGYLSDGQREEMYADLGVSKRKDGTFDETDLSIKVFTPMNQEISKIQSRKELELVLRKLHRHMFHLFPYFLTIFQDCFEKVKKSLRTYTQDVDHYLSLIIVNYLEIGVIYIRPGDKQFFITDVSTCKSKKFVFVYHHQTGNSGHFEAVFVNIQGTLRGIFSSEDALVQLLVSRDHEEQARSPRCEKSAETIVLDD